MPRLAWEGSSSMYILEETMTTILVIVVVLMLFEGGVPAVATRDCT
jgi:hypothetical protein